MDLSSLSLRALLFLLLVVPATAAGPSICFSPGNNCDIRLIHEIDEARETVDIAIYSLSRPSIVGELLTLHNMGVRVRIIADKLQASGRSSLAQKLIAKGVPMIITRGEKGGYMHHKFVVIDGHRTCTGSFNWTKNAVLRSNENLYCFNDHAGWFQTEFNRMWAKWQSKGKNL